MPVVMIVACLGCGSAETLTPGEDGGSAPMPEVDAAGPSRDAAGGSAGDGGATSPPDAPHDAGMSAFDPGEPIVLPRGRVERVERRTGRFTMDVVCPGLATMRAEVKVIEPDAAEPAGTLVIHGGAEGRSHFMDGGFDRVMASIGLRVASIRWISGQAWELTEQGSIKLAACRVATVTQWIRDDLHQGGTARAFCGMGNSGGSGAMAYLLSHYGMEALFDYVFLSSGPVFGRIDYGCEPSLFEGPNYLCPEMPDWQYDYPDGMDVWLQTTTCGRPFGESSEADRAHWADTSIVSPGADFHFDDTLVHSFHCAAGTSGVQAGNGLGAFWLRQVTSELSTHCFAERCTDEDIFTDPELMAFLAEKVSDGCVPRHR